MRKLFRTTNAGSVAMSCILVCACFIAVGRWANAAELKAARVTQIIKDVKLLPPQAAPRPAAVSDDVREGTAVRTGVESRAELTFTDLTITRLGANTVFSFNEGTRELNLDSGAILLQVPKSGAAVHINSSAFTAAVTGGTALLEFNRGAPIKFFILEGTGELCPNGNPSGCVTVHAGEMVLATPGGHITQPTQFNVGKLYETSLLITEFSPLPNQALILQVINQQQQAVNGPSNPSTSSTSTIPIDVLSQRAAASPAATPPPQTGPPVIRSAVPYVINNETSIVTHPTITTNGVTDSGKIWHGTSIDGRLSAFIFGSTSAFDTAIGFDKGAEKITNSGAVFKFTSLELTGNPTVSTANGPTDLALIGVKGITSGGPGGTLTFAGINALLLATQNGSINLGPEISFSGFHDLIFYARGAGSNLTLASAISDTIKLRLFAEGSIQVSSVDATLTAERIRLFAGDSVTLDGGVMSATAANSSGNVDIFAGNDISITHGLEIDRTNGGIGSGLNVALSAGANLTTGGGLTVNADNSGGGNLDSGANITLNAGGNLTINNGDLTLTVADNGGHIGTGGNISVTTGGDLTAGSINALINNRNGGSIDSGGNMTFNIGGALNIANDASLVISMRNTFGTGGGTVGSDVAVNVSAGSVSTGGGFTTVVSTNGGGNISGSASNTVNVTGDFVTQGDSSVTIQNTGFNSVNPYNFVAGGNITGDTAVTLSARNITSSSTDSGTPVTGLLTNSIEASIYNDGSGHIGGNALVNVTASGDITTPGGAVFAIFNDNFMGFGGGTVVGDATVDVSANNITANALTVQIDNTGGSIGGNATINMNVSGTATVTNDATVQILGNDPTGAAAINFNGGSYDVGGTFLSTIDGNGTITFNNASIAADVVKVGALGTNGTLTIGGGSISANSLLKLYAGSNGSIDFVSNVTLSNRSAAVLIAANKVTISNGVVVTIGGSTDPASVFTNLANYTGFGGNGSTTGTFAGNGATTQPLSQAPPFDASSLGSTPSSGTAGANTNAQSVSTANAPSLGKVHVGSRQIGRFQSERNLSSGGGTATPDRAIDVSSAAPSGRNGKRGDLLATSGKTTGTAINVSSSAQLLSLLDAAAPDPLGKITIPASKNTAKSGNSSRSDTRGRLKADRLEADARRVPDRQVIKSTTRSL